jgi:hypothetical protein
MSTVMRTEAESEQPAEFVATTVYTLEACGFARGLGQLIQLRPVAGDQE